MKDERTILQIIPAVGWKAIYANRGTGHHESDLVAWALVREDGLTFIEPYDAEFRGVVDPVDSVVNYVGIRAPGDTDEAVKSMVAEFRRTTVHQEYK